MGKKNKLKAKDRERVIKMATASFTKEFAIKDRKIAHKMLKKINSMESTIKIAPSGLNINQTFSRSEDLLRKFLSR